MLRNLMLVVNPFSGRGLSKTALGEIVSYLCSHGYYVTVYVAGALDTYQLALRYGKNHELAVCVGGDGTLSSVIAGLLTAGVSPTVGYIPSGTANDVAATLALSRVPLAAAQTIVSGTPFPVDIGRFGDRFFTYIAAFGAFTGISYTTKQSAKRALGPLAYIFGGLASVSDIKPRHTKVKYDGGVIEDDFIFGGVMNSTSVAGFVKLDPASVDLSDGLFEVVLVKQPVTASDFIEILTSIRTLSHDGESDNIRMLHSKYVKFSFDTEVAWTLDGEAGGLCREIEIYNCHEAVKIII